MFCTLFLKIILSVVWPPGSCDLTPQRALKGDFVLLNRPTTQAIFKPVMKFDETAVVTNIERPVHYRFGEDPNVSFLPCSQELELSHGTYGVFCIQSYTYIPIKSSSHSN